ncbi:Matrixin [Virgibacillus subterraneus]|uniref:Matrixin n=1 Tax=Virgibacillus subterraneus TaxID=621109 RepID=A0A1H9FLX1_9BACI|nr:matrixin family metalloprotease [Virgibacillus subterraneus]SEQ38921.1 Matrixin [Virgibacillus subterraneus]
MKKLIYKVPALLSLAVVCCLAFVNPNLSPTVEAFTTKGWEFPGNMSFKTTSSYPYINSSWGSAVSVWNNEQDYWRLYRAPGSMNDLTDEYTTSSSRYGVMTTYYDSDNDVTRFKGRLNRSMYAIRSNSRVRQSSAVHEIGHAAGLSHTSNYAIMNTSRDRTELIEPTFDDRNGIDAIY